MGRGEGPVIIYSSNHFPFLRWRVKRPVPICLLTVDAAYCSNRLEIQDIAGASHLPPPAGVVFSSPERITTATHVVNWVNIYHLFVSHTSSAIARMWYGSSHSSLRYTSLPCHRPAEHTYAHPSELVHEVPELNKWTIKIVNLQLLEEFVRSFLVEKYRQRWWRPC